MLPGTSHQMVNSHLTSSITCKITKYTNWYLSYRTTTWGDRNRGTYHDRTRRTHRCRWRICLLQALCVSSWNIRPWSYWWKQRPVLLFTCSKKEHKPSRISLFLCHFCIPRHSFSFMTQLTTEIDTKSDGIILFPDEGHPQQYIFNRTIVIIILMTITVHQAEVFLWLPNQNQSLPGELT